MDAKTLECFKNSIELFNNKINADAYLINNLISYIKANTDKSICPTIDLNIIQTQNEAVLSQYNKLIDNMKDIKQTGGEQPVEIDTKIPVETIKDPSIGLIII